MTKQAANYHNISHANTICVHLSYFNAAEAILCLSILLSGIFAMILQSINNSIPLDITGLTILSCFIIFDFFWLARVFRHRVVLHGNTIAYYRFWAVKSTIRIRDIDHIDITAGRRRYCIIPENFTSPVYYARIFGTDNNGNEKEIFRFRIFARGIKNDWKLLGYLKAHGIRIRDTTGSCFFD